MKFSKLFVMALVSIASASQALANEEIGKIFSAGNAMMDTI